MPEINKELSKDLQAARKKPRNFAIIAKGAQVLQLILDKKPIREGTVANAKRETGGNLVIMGVVQPGEPPELVFQVLEEPSLAEVKLRNFIKEEADLAVKPRFQVVSQLSEVNENEDVSAGGNEQAPNDANAESPVESPPTTGSETPQLPQDAPDPMAAFKERLKNLMPAILQAKAENSPAGLQIVQTAGEAGKSAGQQDFVRAQELLDQVEQALLAKTSGGGEQDPFEPLYLGLLETIPRDLQRIQEINAETAAKLQKVVDGAAGYATKGDFKTAFTYLEKVSAAIAKTLSEARVQDANEVIPEGIVAALKSAFEQAQTRWDAALTTARECLKPVQAELQEEFPDHSAAVTTILDSYEKDLLDELLAGQAKVDEEGLATAVRSTLEKVQSLRELTESDGFFIYLDQCGLPVKAAFSEAFASVEGLLQA